ncbi:hypothetical protein BH11CYA1_BH11CYA1_39250 [soil metagenome]
MAYLGSRIAPGGKVLMSKFWITPPPSAVQNDKTNTPNKSRLAAEPGTLQFREKLWQLGQRPIVLCRRVYAILLFPATQAVHYIG